MPYSALVLQGGQIKISLWGNDRMRSWIKAGLALALAIAPSPLMAQTLNGSEGEAFLKAVEDRDGAKAIPMVEVPGSRVVNYRGYKGDTALHIVTRKREIDWVGFLLKNGADPNVGDAQGDTPLILAARIGFDQAAGYMVQFGAKVDTPNRRGETALIVATQQRRPDIVELLLKAGADPDKTDHAAGYSARDYAKRDTRNRELLRLIETVKSTKKKVAGPSVN
jgi:ankyrin repeat protein